MPELKGVPPGENPLRSSDSRVWDSLIAAVGPPGLMIVIESRMSDALRARMSAEDVWQETLLHAWRSRGDCEWHGVPAFRRWLLRVAENRICDLADAEEAQKRGGGSKPVPLEDDLCQDGRGIYAGPVRMTTPRRAAMDRERAELMKAALMALSDDVREIVRLGLFEDLDMEEVARRIGMHSQAARRRFRRGCEEYYRRVRSAFMTPS